MASNVMMLVVFTILAISSFLNEAHGDPIVPCYFIFGDSLADNGNNNMLNTAAKADFPPYRIDLPGVGSSGRFTDGRAMIDFIGLSFSRHMPFFCSAISFPNFGYFHVLMMFLLDSFSSFGPSFFSRVA